MTEREAAAASARRVQFLLANPDELRKFVSAAEQNADDFIALNRAYSELRAASAPQAVHALTEEETRAVHELVAGAAFVCAITDTAQLVDCTLTATQSVIARRSGIVPLAPQDTGGK